MVGDDRREGEGWYAGSQRETRTVSRILSTSGTRTDPSSPQRAVRIQTEHQVIDEAAAGIVATRHYRISAVVSLRRAASLSLSFGLVVSRERYSTRVPREERRRSRYTHACIISRFSVLFAVSDSIFLSFSFPFSFSFWFHLRIASYSALLP